MGKLNAFTPLPTMVMGIPSPRDSLYRKERTEAFEKTYISRYQMQQKREAWRSLPKLCFRHATPTVVIGTHPGPVRTCTSYFEARTFRFLGLALRRCKFSLNNLQLHNSIITPFSKPLLGDKYGPSLRVHLLWELASTSYHLVREA